ncbi:UDP-N-acetylglucosamine 1-carboxyvinyltransferase [Microcoleus sp. FACHB-SPT15]|uniref:UDP-N-acetylglucosamine 1-carboxyvinyltransferase n=1 Tax=Microcoleus sp. FACHB-SPT15 TaxID=2692830 RepID=UPI00177DC749|nr:UDP-N-acetylglucosamine 1-carboxyvinyltransferase [Microcoleus sp. FACHB-SPT15]MBD1804729.1 UDP-N-acetylglucosamine 1-carboxyvinyltransferase [Microcoleus sp. FACHB-SPT15]
MEDRPINHSLSQTETPSLPEEDKSVLQIWGRTPLHGHVKISGAKNSALAIMAGALLCPQDCRLRNVPSLVDVKRMSQILLALGVKLERKGDILDIDARHLEQSKAPYELVSQLRASFFVIGPVLARLGVARVPLPGGCAIGARPVDLHVRGLQAMGAEVQIDHGMVHAYVGGSGSKKLKGAKIYLDCPSVGATETLMMAATLAEGETTLENAAQEPEVVDLANFCRAMGARIRGAGTNTIIISGVPSLHSVDYSIIPDRIEAGTFLVAGAITNSELSLSPVVPDHLTAVIAKLHEIGSRVITEEPNCLRIVPGRIRAADIETLPYPGFPTDMQAQFMALLAQSEGDSVITETVFENRLRHVAELNRMGADIRVKGNNAIIRGVPRLSGAPVVATDLRASAALVLAGLAAEGKTSIQGLHHLDRGYDNLEVKLRQLGARLQRVQDEAEVGQVSADPSKVTALQPE